MADRFRTTFNKFGQQVINPNEEYWQGFVADWETGGACTAILSTHSPESCLPLTGLTQISPPPGGKPFLIDLQVGMKKSHLKPMVPKDYPRYLSLDAFGLAK